MIHFRDRYTEVTVERTQSQKTIYPRLFYFPVLMLLIGVRRETIPVIRNITCGGGGGGGGEVCRNLKSSNVEGGFETKVMSRGEWSGESLTRTGTKPKTARRQGLRRTIRLARKPRERGLEG